MPCRPSVRAILRRFVGVLPEAIPLPCLALSDIPLALHVRREGVGRTRSGGNE